MRAFKDAIRVQVLRPRVMELEYGAFRGYVDVQGGFPGSCATRVHYCRHVVPSRDRAERQAMELATRLSAASQAIGVATRLLCDSLSDAYAGRRELDNVPRSLLLQDVRSLVTKRHLRIVA